MENLGQPGNPGRMTITEETIRSAPFMKCDCGNGMFEEKLMFKKISRLLSPTAKDEVYPLQVLVCTKCGKVPSDPIFNPGNLIPKEYIASKNDGAEI
jgi:hypothetical protein